MSAANMSVTTPRRSSRNPHNQTPKMSERKKSLFQGGAEGPSESLTKHRRLPVVDSESDSEDCDLGIISTLDSSSGDENDQGLPKTPTRKLWHETRSQTRKLLKENHDLKNFMKSPFTLKKYQTTYSCPESRCTGSLSTPATPHLQNHPVTPSSTHSCASAHTTSSTSSRARKNLASLIADTESCSSSLKDLNFDTDSGTDSKENTPVKSIRRSSRRIKTTPQFHSFKGILMEQKKNVSPMKTAFVCLTKMDMSSLVSPTQMLKTPHNTTETVASPPRLSHNRRSVVEIAESPDSTGDSEKSQKRLRNDSLSDGGPISKYPRLETPKARLSLFNSDRLKEILSTKSFYGKSNPELNTNITAKISSAIEVSNTHIRRPFSRSHSQRRKKKPGQINMGVKHRIRKPKHHNHIKMMNLRYNTSMNSTVNNSMNSTVNTSMNSTVNTSMNSIVHTSLPNNTKNSSVTLNDTSMLSQNSSQELGNDRPDPFDKEKQTIEALLSQWTEEDVPESELRYYKKTEELSCFNSTIIEETKQIFQPITAVQVQADLPQDSETVIIELGADKIVKTVASDVVMAEPEGHMSNHGEVPKRGQFLPVEGGYILVEENGGEGEEILPDLDEIERELRMLDEQILKMAQSNNIDAKAVLASTETAASTSSADMPSTPTKSEESKNDNSKKMFPIFSNPNPGTSTPTSKGTDKLNKKTILKTGDNQYVIDAGQKKFGATQCVECGTIYQIGDPQDEHDHLVHHNATDVLRFNGWKEECVVDVFGASRCLRVRGGESGWKRVEKLLARLVHPALGYHDRLPGAQVHQYTAYLYINKKQIVGCVIVEPKVKAYKLLPGDPDCCSVEEYPVKCGVSRVWTHLNHRRRGVAARLLNCARASFLYGHALNISDLAFSAPTSVGKAFATKYCGTPNFYVYLD